MGSDCVTQSRVSPPELVAKIKSDAGISDALSAEPVEAKAVHCAIRAFVDQYADASMNRAIGAAANNVGNEILAGMVSRAGTLFRQFDAIEKGCKTLQDAARRIPGAGQHADAVKLVEEKYNQDLKVVVETAGSLDHFDKGIKEASLRISELVQQGKISDPEVKQKQVERDVLDKEKEHAEKSLVQHFSSGFELKYGGFREKPTDLEIPGDIRRGGGLGFNKNFSAWLRPRAAQYGVLLHEIIKVCEFSKLGLYYEPPNKKDGFAGVDAKISGRHEAQSRRIWEELELKMPKDIMLDIRTEFTVGPGEVVTRCETGDGLMALYCILAKYRPADSEYREGIKDKLGLMAQMFSDGSDPAVKIAQIRPDLDEAFNLDVKVQWPRTGKNVVSILSERSNTFAQVLAKYNKPGGVVDVNDCVVELDRMFSDITTACRNLDQAGVGLKSGSVNAAWQEWQEQESSAGMCWYGDECTRENCHFNPPGHGKGPKSQGKGSKGKGKGSKGKSKGKSKGSKGKGKGGDKAKEEQRNQAKTCKAKDCVASGRGFTYCPSCHRKGMEVGKVQLKDGSWDESLAEKKKKHANAAVKEVGAERCEEDGMFDVSQQQYMTAANGSVWQRMGGKRAADEEDPAIPGSGGPKSVKCARLEGTSW